MSRELKRVVSLPLITFYGIGSILGAGIYVLISKISSIAGNYMPFSFLLAGIIASFSAFSYAELSSRYPKSAGEAVYIKAAFDNKLLSSLVGWAIVIVGIVSVATLSNGLIGYIEIFIKLPEWSVEIIVISILFLISIWGVKESVIIASVITLVELFGLLLIIYYGFDNLATLSYRWQEFIPPLDPGTYSTIIFGAFLSFYAYIGFEDMVNMAEEVKNPEKNLPVSIILVLVITTILYLLVSLVAVLSLPLEQLSSSDAPFAELIKINSSFPVSVIGIISLIAVLNGMLIQMIMASRILFGMAKKELAPDFFSYISPGTMVPLYSSILVFVMIIIASQVLPLVSLAKLTSTIILIIFTGVNLSLVVIKKRERGAVDSKHISYPIFVPVTGFILSLCFLLYQIVEIF